MENEIRLEGLSKGNENKGFYLYSFLDYLWQDDVEIIDPWHSLNLWENYL